MVNLKCVEATDSHKKKTVPPWLAMACMRRYSDSETPWVAGKKRFFGHQTWLAGNPLFRDDETPAN